MTVLDTRLNAVRPDLADIRLKGLAIATRYVAGEIMQVMASHAPLRREPSHDAMLLTETLFGEKLVVFETTRDGAWAWVQLQDDRYVGWIPTESLGEDSGQPSHKVSALRTFAFARPDIKSPPLVGLPYGARLTVTAKTEDRNARYALIRPAGAVVLQHLAQLEENEADWTAVAERFLGAPYLWGGKTVLGLDCSGLLQVALRACGITAPRDTDMQESAVGAALPLSAGHLPPLTRGDLVFWRGHVGIMQDEKTLLHANAHHMAVASEPLCTAVERMGGRGMEVTSIRRIAPL